MFASSPVRLAADPWVEFNPGLVPYFWRDWSWNNFYGHSPPSADSRRVFVSYKRKYVHLLGQACLETSVARWTYCVDMTIAVDWDIKNQKKQSTLIAVIEFYSVILSNNSD